MRSNLMCPRVARFDCTVRCDATKPKTHVFFDVADPRKRGTGRAVALLATMATPDAAMAATPAVSSTGTASVAPEVSGETDLAGRPIANMRRICTEEGPRRHLQRRWADDMKGFYDGLMALLPVDDTIFYHDSAIVPEVTQADMSTTHPLALHPAMLSFAAVSSIKGPPEANVVEKLTEQIVLDGFITSGDPLLINPISEAQQSDINTPVMNCGGRAAIPAFSVGYVKGSARATTLLCLLSLFVEDKVDLATVRRQSS